MTHFKKKSLFILTVAAVFVVVIFAGVHFFRHEVIRVNDRHFLVFDRLTHQTKLCKQWTNEIRCTPWFKYDDAAIYKP